MTQQTHHTSEQPRITVKLPSGRIELTTRDAQETEVEIEPIGHDEGSVRAADDARQELRGDTLTIEVRDGKRFGLFSGDARVLIRVRAPHGTRLDTRTASADLVAEGRLGSLEASSASGDVRAEQVTGDASTKSASGDVEIASVGGSARVQTVSGDLRIDQVDGNVSAKLVSGDVVIGTAGGDVDVKSVSGEVAVDAVARGETTVKTVSGDVVVGVVRGTRVWLDLNSLSGQSSSELEPSEGSGGGDTLRLRATSTSGDVRVMRSEVTAG